MQLNALHLEKIVLGLVLIGVFAAAFFFFQLAPKPTDQTLNGVHVASSGDAKMQLRGILSKKPVLVLMELYAGNDSRNTALSIATAQIASTLIFYNATNYAYGAVDGNASVNCVAQTDFCQGAVVTVQIGPFDGMRINDTDVVVEGTPDFLSNIKNLKVIQGIFGLAASGS